MDDRLFDEGANPLRIAQLTDRGVDVWGYNRVYVGEDVDVDNIEPGAVLYEGIITGANTRIGAGSKIGVSGPARIHNCQIGRNCELGAGTYDGSTLLDGAKVRGFAELRPGTLLEEEAEAAHCCAFKNTILTAGAVAGSMINFCDAFLTGGTSRSDHSEIGSGAVHFNFDPRGDKWGSLFGDVTGVLMRSAPVFVGGQCGVVAPLHVDFGAVTAAGSIVRRDVGPDCIKFESASTNILQGFDREAYMSLRRKLISTARLIGTLRAFAVWYDEVRIAYAEARLLPLYEAAKAQALAHADERVKRVGKIIDKLPRSIEKTGESPLRDEHQLLVAKRDEILELFSSAPDKTAAPGRFLDAYSAALTEDESAHIGALRGLPDDAVEEARAWLVALAETYPRGMEAILS